MNEKARRHLAAGIALLMAFALWTALLVLGVMPTLQFQVDRRSDSPSLREVATALVAAFSALMVAGRLVSGVHWAIDIVGSVLLAFGLLALYRCAVEASDARCAPRQGD